MATVQASNQLYQHKESMKEVLMVNINKVIYDSTDRLTPIDDQLQELQKELLKKANSNQEYDELVQDIYELREEKQRVITEAAESRGLKSRIQEMEDFIKGFALKLNDYDGHLVRTYIEKITVFDNYFSVEFKAGFKFDIERVK